MIAFFLSWITGFFYNTYESLIPDSFLSMASFAADILRCIPSTKPNFTILPLISPNSAASFSTEFSSLIMN
jgi:hypothetical protein